MTRTTRKCAAITGVLALLLIGPVAYAAEAQQAAKTATWNGWITDEACGVKNANAEGKACALKCAKKGSKLVLYVESDKTLVGLDDQEEAIKHLGHPVTVTGTLEAGVIKVQKIEAKKG